MDDLIYETDCSSENREEEKLNLLVNNYTEILKVRKSFYSFVCFVFFCFI